MKKEVKIGIIGCGAIARQYHMPALRQAPSCKVVAVCDLIPERAIFAAEMFGLREEDTYLDAEKLLKREDVEAVIILTPNYNHCELTVLAANHKKHVFITKPMGRNLEECRRMEAACKDNGVKLVVSFMHRYLTGIAEAKRLIEEGYIGKVEMARVLNAPGATSTLSEWFYSRENVGGGCVIDIGVHGIDLVNYLIGKVDTVLYADIGRYRKTVISNGKEIEPDNEDHASVIYRTENGVTVNHLISWPHWSIADRFSMEIFGSNGSIFLRGAMGTLTVCRADGKTAPVWMTPQIRHEPIGINHHEAFADVIINDKKEKPGASDGSACIKVVEEIYRKAAK